MKGPIESTADSIYDDDDSFRDHHVFTVASGIHDIACVENRLRLVGRLLEETVLFQLLPSRHGLLPVQLAHERVRRIAQHVCINNRVSVGEVLLIANHVRTAKVGGGVDLLRIASVEHVATNSDTEGMPHFGLRGDCWVVCEVVNNGQYLA